MRYCSTTTQQTTTEQRHTHTTINHPSFRPSPSCIHTYMCACLWPCAYVCFSVSFGASTRLHRTGILVRRRVVAVRSRVGFHDLFVVRVLGRYRRRTHRGLHQRADRQHRGGLMFGIWMRYEKQVATSQSRVHTVAVAMATVTIWHTQAISSQDRSWPNTRSGKYQALHTNG